MIKSISLVNFKNFKKADVNLSPEINVFFGENAQGKTNLLDSVHVLSTFRSFCCVKDRDMILFDENNARIFAEVFAQGRDQTVEIILDAGRKKKVKINGVLQKTFKSIIKTVLFTPEDMQIIQAGASDRRRFLDQSISQLRVRYQKALSEYNRLLEHKQNILKSDNENMIDTLDVFNQKMAVCGAVIINYRNSFLNRLNEEASKIHFDISGKKEMFELKYNTVKTVNFPITNEKDIYDALRAHQESHKTAEIEARACLSGPHKDDFSVYINGILAKSFASRGQSRTAALALKLGVREIYFREDGEYPIMLLDDVLGELDNTRQEFLLSKIGGGQVIITDCKTIPNANARYYLINSGAATCYTDGNK